MSKLVKTTAPCKDHSTQRKGWCVTTNIGPHTNLEEEKNRFASPVFQYSIFEPEVGALNSQLHLQGYVHFVRKCRFAAVQRQFPNSHIEPARGSALQNRAYCSKDGAAVEYGSLPLLVYEQVNDKWATAKQQAIEGELDEIEPQVLIKYYSTLKRINQDATAAKDLPTLDWKHPPNLWIWGPTGTGKSLRARQECSDPYVKMTNKWWDRYDHEPHVLIEDIGRSHLYLGDYLKIWADRYPFAVEVKHGGMMIRPAKIVVTSNYSIEQLWPEEEICEPLKRRFQVINLVRMHQYDMSPKVSSKSPRYMLGDDGVDMSVCHDEGCPLEPQAIYPLLIDNAHNIVPPQKCVLCDEVFPICECTRCLVCGRLELECNCTPV